jgi:hypothetical protein
VSRVFRVCAPLLLTACLAACSSGLDQKVDASSDAAFRDSLARIQSSSSPAQVQELNDALRILAVSDVSIGYEGGILGALKKLEGQPTEQLRELVQSAVAGKSGKAIIAAATQRRKEQASKQLAAVEEELSRLNKAGAEYETNKEVLTKIEIALPRLGYAPTGTGTMAMLEFKVTNNTETRLTALFLRASAVDPGSTRVLFADDINYKLPAGLAPGESKDIRLPYSQPGKWNAPELSKRSETELEISVVNAESAPGKKLVPNFTHKDAQRVAELEQEKPLLQKMVQGK